MTIKLTAETVICQCGKVSLIEDAYLDEDGNWNCKKCIEERTTT